MWTTKYENVLSENKAYTIENVSWKDHLSSQIKYNNRKDKE